MLGVIEVCRDTFQFLMGLVSELSMLTLATLLAYSVCVYPNSQVCPRI